MTKTETTKGFPEAVDRRRTANNMTKSYPFVVSVLVMLLAVLLRSTTSGYPFVVSVLVMLLAVLLRSTTSGYPFVVSVLVMLLAVLLKRVTRSRRSKKDS
jgi:cytochrome bd-type quinol oxidase subunit 2